MHVNLELAIVSLFCAGGLFAYVREALRLRRLMSAGKIALATVVNTKVVDSGSESVKHYLVTYEFVDDKGRTVLHEQDINSSKFFRTLKNGETMEVLYEADVVGNSYPVSQIRSDQKLSYIIALAILVVWVAMALFFATS